MSGRDPLPDNIEEEDENTLDDISGDEVRPGIHHARLCQPPVPITFRAVTLDLNWTPG